MMAARVLKDAQAVEPLQWYAMRMVPPTNGHRRTAKLGGEMATVKRRAGQRVYAVARRKPGTGKRVFVPEHILRRAGFAVFLPVKKVWCRKHRFTTEQELVAFPIVADWLFVGWSLSEARWHELAALKVVTGVLGSDGRPVRIKGKTVAKLMQRWGDGVPPAVRRVAVDAQRGLAAGDPVRVLSGPFEDFKGDVIDVDGTGARVAIDIFGRSTPAEFKHSEIMPLKPAAGQVPGLLASGAPGCLRCGEPMVLAHDPQKDHHLRCSECGAVGAVNSSSEIRALEVWAQRVTSATGV